MPERDGLTIGELATRSGVNESTIRMWEARHGYPSPRRLPRGHRRYSEHDVDAVRAIVQARAEGFSLVGAIERAKQLQGESAPSVYTALRHRFPELQPHVLEKRALVHLSRALEDECLLRARRPLVFGAFQRERFFRASEARWRELARTAELAVVFADFPRERHPRRAPVEIPLAGSDELRREWVIVFDAPNVAACLAAWERPGGTASARRFETIWTVERPVARHAARICAELAARSQPALVEAPRRRLAERPLPDPADTGLAVAVASRMVAYAAEGAS